MAETGKEKMLIIIPAYNEENNIEALIDELQEEEIQSIADFVIINDGSVDRTADIVRERNGNLVSHIYNLGYGSALQTGYKYAVRNGYRYVMQMDADGQHDVCNIRQIYKQLQTPDENQNYPDIVLGSRFMEESSPYEAGKLKKIAIALFRGLIRIATGQKVTDPTSGLQGLSPRVVKYYAGYNHYDDQYPDANMIMQMLLLGFRIREYPAVMHQRVQGVSMHSGLKPIIYMLRMALCMLAVWGRVCIFKIDAGIADREEYDCQEENP